MHRRRSLRTLRVALASVVLLAVAAGCGADADDTTVGAGVPGSATPTTLTGPPPTNGAGDAGGWIGGEPDWDAATGGSGGGGAERSSAEGAGPVPAMAPGGSAIGDAASATAPGGDAAMPAPAGAPLRAGSVDDNADLAGYLAYLQRVEDLGIPHRPFDPSGRIVVTVTGDDGLPIDGEPVVVSVAGDVVTELRTSGDGQVVFLPAMYGPVAESYTFTAGPSLAEGAPGSAVDLPVARPGGAPAGVAVDVLFLLDVTGSMGDEIAQLTATIAEVSERLGALEQRPDIRFGMTLFRDEGDLFVTSTYDFTSDIGSFRDALDGVVADGGGDTPEAVDEAFAAALAEPSWRDPGTTVQLMFLVGDAAPQVGRQVEQPYTTSILRAAERGITVHAIAASQTDDPAEVAFRHIAQGTGGRFVFLAYGAAGSATGASTDIASTDYEELSLDDLVVRLVGEELAALTGTPFVDADPDPTVPPTNPPGQ